MLLLIWLMLGRAWSKHYCYTADWNGYILQGNFILSDANDTNSSPNYGNFTVSSEFVTGIPNEFQTLGSSYTIQITNDAVSEYVEEVVDEIYISAQNAQITPVVWDNFAILPHHEIAIHFFTFDVTTLRSDKMPEILTISMFPEYHVIYVEGLYRSCSTCDWNEVTYVGDVLSITDCTPATTAQSLLASPSTSETASVTPLPTESTSGIPTSPSASATESTSGIPTSPSASATESTSGIPTSPSASATESTSRSPTGSEPPSQSVSKNTGNNTISLTYNSDLAELNQNIQPSSEPSIQQTSYIYAIVGTLVCVLCIVAFILFAILRRRAAKRHAKRNSNEPQETSVLSFSKQSEKVSYQMNPFLVEVASLSVASKETVEQMANKQAVRADHHPLSIPSDVKEFSIPNFHLNQMRLEHNAVGKPRHKFNPIKKVILPVRPTYAPSLSDQNEEQHKRAAPIRYVHTETPTSPKFIF